MHSPASELHLEWQNTVTRTRPLQTRYGFREGAPRRHTPPRLRGPSGSNTETPAGTHQQSHKQPPWGHAHKQAQRTHTQPDTTRPSSTQTHTTHGYTRHDRADCGPAVPTQSDISRPHTLRPGESHEAPQTAAGPVIPRHAVTPRVPDGAIPHTQTHPQGRGPHTPSPCLGLRTSPGRTPRGRPCHALVTHPAHLPAWLSWRRGRPGRETCGLSTFLDCLQAAPALLPSTPSPAGWGRSAGRGESWPWPSNQSWGRTLGFRETRPPPPLLRAAPGGEGSRGGSLGSGWSPSFPSSPHGAGSRAGEASSGLPAPSPQRGLGAGSAGRSGESRGGGGGMNEKAPSALNLMIGVFCVSYVKLNRFRTRVCARVCVCVQALCSEFCVSSMRGF